jgi:hypothetical protein
MMTFMWLRKNRVRVVRVTLLTAALYLVVAPPGADHADADVLATVDGAPAVTAADVLYYFESRGAAAERTPVDADDVAKAVDEIVMAKVLVSEAEAAGYGDAESVKKEVAKFQRETLRESMLRVLRAESPVTEKDLRAFYETDLKWRKYSVIMCKNRGQAEAARLELAEGKAWNDVFTKYAINDDKAAAGAFGTPLVYDGREASRAVFETPTGEYSPAVPANDGIRWYVYRVDKVVHGRIDTFDEARQGLVVAISGLRSLEKTEKIVAKLRQSVPVNRKAEMWRALLEEPFAAFEAQWGTPTVVIGDAGGIPIFGAPLIFMIYDFLGLGAGGLDEYRARDPEDVAYVADRILTQLEDQALLEYEAIERGLDKDDAYVRGCENRRAYLITDLFIAREFTANLPPLTEADVQRYYDAHPEQFLIPEMLECYIIALPDREMVRAFYERVVGGESIFDVGETYNQKRGRELADAYEAPPRLPPEKEDFVRAIMVYREPNPKEPELPLTMDLRGRVFASTEPGTLSDVFQLADGRWAFYEVTYYRPAGKEDISQEDTMFRCRRLAWAEYLSSDEVNLRAREWLAALRAKHDVKLAPELYADVAAAINNR